MAPQGAWPGQNGTAMRGFRLVPRPALSLAYVWPQLLRTVQCKLEREDPSIRLSQGDWLWEIPDQTLAVKLGKTRQAQGVTSPGNYCPTIKTSQRAIKIILKICSPYNLLLLHHNQLDSLLRFPLKVHEEKGYWPENVSAPSKKALPAPLKTLNPRALHVTTEWDAHCCCPFPRKQAGWWNSTL